MRLLANIREVGEDVKHHRNGDANVNMCELRHQIGDVFAASWRAPLVENVKKGDSRCGLNVNM